MEGRDVVHWGILGQRWGVRRYQNPDGTLTELGKAREAKARAKEEARAERKDLKWINKRGSKIYNKAYKKSRRQLAKEDKKLKKNLTYLNKDGSINKEYALAYNKIMADLMNSKVSNLSSPSGKVVRFVAKRGELGVHTALADRDYDMSLVDKGVYGGKRFGKVAYSKRQIEVK